MSRKRPEGTSKNETRQILILCTQQCSEKDRHSRSLSDLLQVPISHIRTYKAFAQHALEATPTSSPDYVCLVLYLFIFCLLFVSYCSLIMYFIGSLGRRPLAHTPVGRQNRCCESCCLSVSYPGIYLILILIFLL